MTLCPPARKAHVPRGLSVQPRSPCTRRPRTVHARCLPCTSCRLHPGQRHPHHVDTVARAGDHLHRRCLVSRQRTIATRDRSLDHAAGELRGTSRRSDRSRCRSALPHGSTSSALVSLPGPVARMSSRPANRSACERTVATCDPCAAAAANSRNTAPRQTCLPALSSRPARRAHRPALPPLPCCRHARARRPPRGLPAGAGRRRVQRSPSTCSLSRPCSAARAVTSSRQVCVSIPYCLRSRVAIAPHRSRSNLVNGRPSSASRSTTVVSTCARRCEEPLTHPRAALPARRRPCGPVPFRGRAGRGPRPADATDTGIRPFSPPDTATDGGVPCAGRPRPEQGSPRRHGCVAANQVCGVRPTFSP